MARQTTETGRTLTPEAHYAATVLRVEKKNVQDKFTIYEWTFVSDLSGQPFEFTVGLFSSQMRDLLLALGGEEIAPNKIDWDDELVIGKKVNFLIVHEADKKGKLREVLVDVKSENETALAEKSHWEE